VCSYGPSLRIMEAKLGRDNLISQSLTVLDNSTRRRAHPLLCGGAGRHLPPPARHDPPAASRTDVCVVHGGSGFGPRTRPGREQRRDAATASCRENQDAAASGRLRQFAASGTTSTAELLMSPTTTDLPALVGPPDLLEGAPREGWLGRVRACRQRMLGSWQHEPTLQKWPSSRRWVCF